MRHLVESLCLPVVAASLLAGGCGGSEFNSAGDGGAGGGGGSGAAGASGGAAGSAGAAGSGGGQATSSQLDLLFVVDNSVSMADKQALLAASVEPMIDRITNPRCVDDAGNRTRVGVGGDCPVGSQREFQPVVDMHVGVITSSLGSYGSPACREDGGQAPGSTPNDRGHLVPTLRGLASYQGQGYFVWDPLGRAEPPGESDPAALAAALQATITAAGEAGCGYEATLEAAYRFLADPQPVLTWSQGTASGVDDELLAQRAAFLRPRSAVMVVLLSDENDCSVDPSGQGWLVGEPTLNMPRGTSACAENPNSPCCRPCAGSEETPPSGCVPLELDTACLVSPTLDPSDDQLNLRCFDQKRRFGIDLLYPLERYWHALESPALCPGEAGLDPARCEASERVTNPLFAQGRDPSLVSLTTIVGVPWQDIARDPTKPKELSFMQAAELTSNGRWTMLTGEPGDAAHAPTPPSDPFMLESIAPRSGQNPVIGAAILPPDSAQSNPINGHELSDPQRGTLQYACIFPLTPPRDCSAGEYNCDCSGTLGSDRLDPVCQEPSTGTYGNSARIRASASGVR